MQTIVANTKQTCHCQIIALHQIRLNLAKTNN